MDSSTTLGTKTRICVIGAGAIGGFLAAGLARAGHEVSIVARGNTLHALRRHGIRFESGAERYSAPVRASDRAEELGRQELVIVAVKAPALPAAARLLPPLLDRESVVVPAQNGLPWWYFLAAGGQLAGQRLRSVDADGSIEDAIPVSQVVGAVVFPSCSCPEPGLVRHASGSRLVFGEPRGGESGRVNQLVRLFKHAGFDAQASENIRREIWLKLLGNACWNPVSLLTGASTDRLIADEALHRLFIGMMEEMIALGRALGIETDLRPADRIEVTRKLGSVKTSMLQDVEAGRSVEIDAILGSLVETAEAVGFPDPRLRTVYALARMRARVLGLYPS
jgi:2-dehydropantoate 2-reductase